MKTESFLKETGNKVKAARNSKGISVRKLGKMCNIDYSNLSRFENGQVNIGVYTLKRIADSLGVDIRKLL